MINEFKNIWALLNVHERRRFLQLVALMCVASLLDVFGIASLLPFLALVADPEMALESPLVAWVAESLGNPAPRKLLTLAGGLVFTAVMVGIVARAGAFYALINFVRMRELYLGERLLQRYLTYPYAWFLGRNSSDLGTSLLSEVGQVVNGPFNAAVRIIAQTTVAAFIIGLLIAIDPQAALGAGFILGGSYLGITYLLHRQMSTLGHIRRETNRARFRIANEAFGGIKDVKIMNLEARYLSRYQVPTRRYARAQGHAALIGEMPRYLFEAIAFGGMILFVLFLLLRPGSNLQSVLPVLGAYAFAGVRLFPAMQGIFQSVTQLRFGAPALKALREDLAEPAPTQAASTLFTPLQMNSRLELENISFRYSAAKVLSLADLSLSIEAGSTVGIVGSTGAGKSTLVDIILGLLVPEEGEMRADGKVLKGETLYRWRQSIGYVPQSIYLSDATVASNIAFGVPEDEIDHSAVELAARQAQLEPVIADLPDGYSTMIGERGTRLSGGQRQRIGIARALYRNPSILVMDEATSALDNITEKALMQTVRKLGGEKTILMIAHRLSTVRHCDRIFVLERGHLSSTGTYNELVAHSSAFRRLHDAAS